MLQHFIGQSAFLPLPQDRNNSYSPPLPRESITLGEYNYNPKEEYEGVLQVGYTMKGSPGSDLEEDMDNRTGTDISNSEFKGIGSQSTERSNNTSASIISSSSKGEADSHKQQVSLILEKLKESKELIEAINKYQCKNKEMTIEKIRALPNTKVKRFKDSIYIGEIVNSIRHGKGIMIYADLRTYEGDWENDLKHGKGVEILSNMNKYEGNFLNGKPDGVGTYIWANGEVYEGEWKNGVKHGSGMWRGSKGETYIGEWKDGKVDGYGVHTWRTGDRYEGELKSFLKHGKGTERFTNGDYYVGTYVNGKPDGYGEYYWANGSQYKGDFKNGLRHGKGIWKKAAENADTYDGEWLNDKKHGQGMYNWSSGNYYKGGYFDDFRHGYGEMHWSDGSYYKGLWERGIQHGKGELAVLNKDLQKGLFVNNVLMSNGRPEKEVKKRDNSFDHRYAYESLNFVSQPLSTLEKTELPELKRVYKGKIKERSNSESVQNRMPSSRTNVSYDQSLQSRESSPPQKQVIKLNEIKNPPRNFKKLQDVINPQPKNNGGKKFLQSIWKPTYKAAPPQEKNNSYLDHNPPNFQFLSKPLHYFNK